MEKKNRYTYIFIYEDNKNGTRTRYHTSLDNLNKSEVFVLGSDLDL